MLEDGDRPLLEVFQAFPPPLSPKDLQDSTACSYPLMNHVFGNSAEKPYVGATSLSLMQTHSSIGAYKPLCGSDWDVAVLNLSVVSYGRQFDRLGVFLYIEYRLILEYLDCRHRSVADLHCRAGVVRDTLYIFERHYGIQSAAEFTSASCC